MAISRLKKRRTLTATRDDELYKKVIENRGLNSITFFETAAFTLDDSQTNLDFSFKEEYWKDGYRLHKLSQKYYNSVEYWWLIGLFNQKPTDSHYENGDLVLIPYPLEDALEFVGVY